MSTTCTPPSPARAPGWTLSEETDVRPLLGRLRDRLGVDSDPVEAFRRGGFGERLARERGSTTVESAYERT